MPPIKSISIPRPNDDVDATGPGTSLGTDADGAPRTCGDLPALPGCIPRLVRSLDDAADRHRVPNNRTLPKRPGGTSGIFQNTGKHHFVSRMAAAATPENPDGSYSLPHHPSAAHPSRGSRPQANRINSPRSRGWRSRKPGTSHPLSQKSRSDTTKIGVAQRRKDAKDAPNQINLNPQTERLSAPTGAIERKLA